MRILCFSLARRWWHAECKTGELVLNRFCFTSWIEAVSALSEYSQGGWVLIYVKLLLRLPCWLKKLCGTLWFACKQVRNILQMYMQNDCTHKMTSVGKRQMASIVRIPVMNACMFMNVMVHIFSCSKRWNSIHLNELVKSSWWNSSSFTEWKCLFHCMNKKTFIICFIWTAR